MKFCLTRKGERCQNADAISGRATDYLEVCGLNGKMLDYERIPRVEFDCVDIVRQAASILRKQWRTYLWWGWLPLLAVSTGVVLLSVDKLLAGSGVLALAAWMTVPFSVNVLRHILLGERGGHPATQLFAGRTWSYIGNGILMHLWRMLLSLLLGIVPIALGVWLFFLMDSATQTALGKVFDKDVLRELISYLGFLVLAEQWVLIWPDVAVDGPASFSRLKAKAWWARWRIIKIMAIIWVAPYALLFGGDALGAFASDGASVLSLPLYAAGGVAYVLASALSTVTGAILYAMLIQSPAELGGKMPGGDGQTA